MGMQPVTDETLDRADALLAALEAAVDGDDLPTVAALNADLDAILHESLEGCHAWRQIPADDAVERVGERLEAILARHGRLAVTLAAMRGGAAAELGRKRRSRHGAASFLETAGA